MLNSRNTEYHFLLVLTVTRGFFLRVQVPFFLWFISTLFYHYQVALFICMQMTYITYHLHIISNTIILHCCLLTWLWKCTVFFKWSLSCFIWDSLQIFVLMLADRLLASIPHVCDQNHTTISVSLIKSYILCLYSSSLLKSPLFRHWRLSNCCVMRSEREAKPIVKMVHVITKAIGATNWNHFVFFFPDLYFDCNFFHYNL